MSESSIKCIYTSMLDTGELQEMFPDMFGIWEKDKNMFSSMYNNNEETISDHKFYTSEDLYEEEEN